jgi:hypothetical protein
MIRTPIPTIYQIQTKSDQTILTIRIRVGSSDPKIKQSHLNPQLILPYQNINPLPIYRYSTYSTSESGTAYR